PTLSLQIEQVVLTALAKEPKQRFPSIQAFATAFEKACTAGSATPSIEKTEPAKSIPLPPDQSLRQKPRYEGQALELGVVQPPPLTHPDQTVPTMTPVTEADLSPLQLV